jgi:hypothetical protein
VDSISVTFGHFLIIDCLGYGGAAPNHTAVQIQFLLLPLQDSLFNRTRSHEPVNVNNASLADAVNSPNSLNVFLRIPIRC